MKRGLKCSPEWPVSPSTAPCTQKEAFALASTQLFYPPGSHSSERICNYLFSCHSRLQNHEALRHSTLLSVSGILGAGPEAVVDMIGREKLMDEWLDRMRR